MTSDVKKVISKLEEARGKEKMSSQFDDTDLIDIWNADERIFNKQNYYFVGSRGSGKTTLIDKGCASIQNTNQRQLTRVITCVLRCSSRPRSSEETVPRIHDIRDFLAELFNDIRAGFNQFTHRKAFSKWLNNYEWNFIINGLRPKVGTPNEINESEISRFRLKLMSDIGSFDFSVLDVGSIINVGKFQFKPIRISYEQETDYNKSSDEISKKSSTTTDRQVQGTINRLIRKTVSEIHRTDVEQIIVYVDDMHFLSLDLQTEIVDALLNLSRELGQRNTTFSIKIFSGTDKLND